MTMSVLIIGAGIAGASAAYACAARGMEVTMLERHAHAAAEASGNPAGILYPYMASKWDAATLFYLNGFAHTVALLPTLQKAGARFSLCGMEHSPKDNSEKERERLRALPAALGLAADTAYPTEEGLFMPHSGWADVPSVVHAMLAGPHIRLYTYSEAHSVHYETEKWHVISGQGSYTGDALILANAYEAAHLFPDHTLPMRCIRGQITYVPEQFIVPVEHVLCYGGYLTPAIEGMHYLGATFEKNRLDTEVDSTGHLFNLETLQDRFLDRLRDMPDPALLEGRAALRTVSADRFPIVGALHNETAWCRKVTGMPYQPHFAPALLPQCYVTLAHGARGLVSAPLAAEMLAGAIAGHMDIGAFGGFGALLSPARFAMRAWRKRGTNKKEAGS